MYKLEITTGPATEPVTRAELTTWKRQRSSITDEDTLKDHAITSARMAFESLAQRPVITTVFRQYVGNISNGIHLARGGVTAIGSVYYYDIDDDLTLSTTHSYDITISPAIIWWDTLPSVSRGRGSVAYANFTAGWANAGAVPQDIKDAIALHASYLFDTRNSYGTEDLLEVPMGFKTVAARYALGFISDWGM